MYKLTHSLLYAWDFATQTDTENALDDFRRTLRREPYEITAAMQAGIDFEAAVCHYNAFDCLPVGEYTDAEKRAVKGFSARLRGSSEQVRIEKAIELDGVKLLLVGVADFVKAGVIYDTKRVQRYEYGKYVSSTQHPMYFELIPEARKFEYLIFTGSDAVTETYRREETQDIRLHIKRFLKDMQAIGLLEEYKAYWGVN